MRKIRKYQNAGILYPGLVNGSWKYEVPEFKLFKNSSIGTDWQSIMANSGNTSANKTGSSSITGKHFGNNQLLGTGIGMVTDFATDKLSSGIFGDSELGRGVGSIFSQGISSAGNTMANNVMMGSSLTSGLGQNIRGSVGGAAGGLAAGYLGKGVTSLMGNSKLGKFTGGAIASGGGQVLGGLLGGTGIGIGNPYTFAANVLGSGLQAMTGPSKEYGGRHGNITKTMDAIYGGVQGVAATLGPVGMGVSAAMALNKGLSNLFGSTDGMCVCAGTKVFTANGDIINIENLKQEQGIIGWNQITHEIRPNTIKGFLEPRQKECLEIELKNGTILRCSIDHPILSNNRPKAESHYINGKRIAFREWSFKRADELKVGDWVGFANNIDYWGNVWRKVHNDTSIVLTNHFFIISIA